MKPSTALDLNRDMIRLTTSRFRASNPRIFGSVSRGTDHQDSDIDILVDPLPGATLFDLGGLQVALEELLGVKVDLLTIEDFPPRLREHVLAGGAAYMKAELRLVERLKHIFEAAIKAVTYVEGMNDASFSDERTRQAVILNLLIIGEATSSLLKTDATFLDRHPEIEWKNMKGMRNRIVHAYFDVSLKAIWDTVNTDLPVLVARLPAIIALAEAEQPPC